EVDARIAVEPGGVDDDDLAGVDGLVAEERQDAVVDEVGAVDPGEAAGDDQAEAEIARRQRRVLAARALAVVVAGHDGVRLAGVAERGRALRIARIEEAEGEGGDLRDVAA